MAYCCCFASVWLFARSNIFWSVFAVLLNCKPDPNWTLNWPSFPFHAAGTHFRGREPDGDDRTLVRRLLFGLAFAELIRTKSFAAGPLAEKLWARKLCHLNNVNSMDDKERECGFALSMCLSLSCPHVCVENSWLSHDLPPLLFGSCATMTCGGKWRNSLRQWGKHN